MIDPPRFSFGYRIGARCYFRDAVLPGKNPYVIWAINHRRFWMLSDNNGDPVGSYFGLHLADFAALVPDEDKAALVALSMVSS